ncbi:ribosome biogenesis GTPase Der [Pseudidiomarina terrestris]|uniref:GTPase Der n=1 Tax=Pseudidiomarina terrestris TaxID=2820060 RepID=A0AAW7QZY3_9GAMM|nr:MULTISPECIES: ribosome biogenesis GTPase Der [unclassified Pseudidiomarina]MDN7124440.1 ribosome biogenesis GTPase Der [Pseudidiomarina sp. 1APP75-32.1]MDN7127005.1 ribosome biogenesis GTPase Der [Pseudidiomarina sp. 1APR75-33.1]MDN7129269.1 ribosome biogenesis GTPase Der [Pseudidiomarina sp. 1APR75-15]MDN7134465.1 ribosome biogenesis GTPase Der [Pseudidiomarina sp. 1ASP75-5]MDN7136846.1 ribosome biogenesis GTPase Der [Pseudidiomarina sp. 1ASP75-14]
MLPVVALVGRPNVGKSTLFNRLTRTRDALVADFPGLTRDRKYGRANYDGYQFIVIDTAGVHGDEEGIDAEMASQSLRAIDEADVVLFMVDARDGITSADMGIAKHLRNIGKKAYVVANKIDGIDAEAAQADFYELGLGEIYGIAAAHGRGVEQLLTRCFTPLTDDYPELLVANSATAEATVDGEAVEASEDLTHDQIDYDSLPLKLAIVGRPNVGKSTLTNRILGEERVVVFDMPGTTRDSIYIPMERDGREYILIDTAGVRRRGKIDETVEKFSVIKTLQAIDDANVVICVVDARETISDQDLNLIGFALNAGRSIVIAVNKWDGLTNDHREEIKRELDRRLGFVDFARVHFISALHGSGVGNLFESVLEAYASATQRVGTSKLTRILETAVDEHQPPLVRGRRVKLKYAHAGGYNPPRVIIHGNQVTDLPGSYQRYLTNYFRKSLGIMGTPIKVEFRESENPFAGRKNKLTTTQLRKRKRLMKFIKKK